MLDFSFQKLAFCEKSIFFNDKFNFLKDELPLIYRNLVFHLILLLFQQKSLPFLVDLWGLNWSYQTQLNRLVNE